MRTRKTSRLAVPALGLLTLASACQESLPTALSVAPELPVAAVIPGHGEPGEEQPFRLEADAVFAGRDFAPDFGPPAFGRSEFDGRCSDPSDFVIRFDLEGRATHLGEFTGRAEHCVRLDFTTGGFDEADGFLRLTSASGAELHATYFGHRGPGPLEEPVTFVGGTGRFASAWGEGVARPVCDLSTGTCVYALEGVIAYVASDASGS